MFVPHAESDSQNTFAEHLSPFGFDIFQTLVVDLLHEFELGVLKSVLKHLIRILYALDPRLVTTLNERLVSEAFHFNLPMSSSIDFLKRRHLELMEFAVFQKMWQK